MTKCLLTDVINNHGINVINNDYEYENSFDGDTWFNVEMGSMEDILDFLRGEILEEE